MREAQKLRIKIRNAKIGKGLVWEIPEWVESG